MAHNHEFEARQIKQAIHERDFRGVKTVNPVTGPNEVDPQSHTLEFSNGTQAVALYADVVKKIYSATTEEELEKSFDDEHPELIGWDPKAGTFTPLTLSKCVIVEVIGGDSDGLVLDSQQSEDLEKIRSLMFMTNNGKVGSGFKGTSLSELHRVMDGANKFEPEKLPWGFINYYWVRERLVEGDTVMIRMYHEGKKVSAPGAN